ncbi:MAG: hypothetical protein FWD78_02840 [Treponema sp.]|nr:hypothetical protein [Treponema sp.]
MNFSFKTLLKAFAKFWRVKRNRYLSFLVLISLIALVEYLVLGLVRRTFVFYSDLDGSTIVEDRMFHGSSSRETDIRRYVEEIILGPVSPDAALLIPRETALQSLLYRDGVVYADFSVISALPPDTAGLPQTVPPEDGVFRSFLTINEGIRRNFSYVKDVKLFIGGNEIFFNEFRAIFTEPADNTNKTGQKALTN